MSQVEMSSATAFKLEKTTILSSCKELPSRAHMLQLCHELIEMAIPQQQAFVHP